MDAMNGRRIVLITGPTVATAALVGVLVVRRSHRRRGPLGGEGGPDPSGVREPLRPLVPTASGAEGLPLPE
jgi:hypothetical protein